MTATGLNVKYAAANIVANFTCAADPIKGKVAAAHLVGAATVAGAISTTTIHASAALIGSGAIAAEATATKPAAASMSANCNAVTVAHRVQHAAGALSVSGANAVQAHRVGKARATLTASATIASAAHLEAKGASALAAPVTMSAHGDKRKYVSAALSVSESTSVSAHRRAKGKSALTAAGTVSGSASRTRAARAALPGSATIQARAVAEKSASAAMGFSGVLAANGERSRQASAVIGGSGSLSAAGRINRAYSAAASLSASGSMNGSPDRSRRAAASLTVTGSLAPAAHLTAIGQSSLVASANVSATAHTAASGSADISAVVSLESAAWEHICTATVWHLLHSDDITDLVSTRIYPSYATEQGHFKAKSPLILYEMLDYQHEHELDGAAGVALATIQFTAMSNSHTEAIAVANALKAELQGYSDFLHSRDAFNVWLENQSESLEQPDPGSDVTIYEQTLIFNVLHRETSPMLLLPYDLGSNQVEKGIVTYLLAQPALAAIDNRLFPLRRPQRSELPAIVYRRKATNEDLDLEGGIDIVQPVFEFEIIADSHAEVYFLSEMMRTCLDGLTGAVGETNALTVTLLGESEACELKGAGKQSAYYRLTQEYEFMCRN